MKKLITSIFLIMSLVVSGLASLSYTPVASAINKSAVRCDFLGQYIQPDTKKCVPCPVDSYCPLVSGTEIENCASKGYPESDCKETRKIYSIDKALPCAAGKTTKGFTFNTLQGTRITVNGDPIFPIVGQGATDASMCQAPDFVCSSPTPVLLKGLDGVAKCYPANTCNADQVPIFKDGIPDCSVACKSNVIVAGKCYQKCQTGEYLEVVGETVICKKITVKPIDCQYPGQIATTPGDVRTCACVSPQIFNENTKSCSLPIVPCVAPQTGNQPNCVNPPSNPCPANQYGYSQPNCKPCPLKGTSPAGTLDSSGCVIPVTPCPANYFGANGNVLCTPCPKGGTSPAGSKLVTDCKIPEIVVTPCPANYYGENGNVLCTPCPNNGTSPVGTKVVTDCKAAVVTANNNGGGSIWDYVLPVVGIGAAACLFKIFGFCGGGSSTPTPTKTASTTTPRNNIPNSTPGTQYDIIKKSSTVAATCSESNSYYVDQVYAVPGSHKESSGNKFFWVETNTSGQKTVSMSTIRDMKGNEIPALKCLMTRFYEQNSGISGIAFGNSIYMKELKRIGVLHGLNTDVNSKGYLHECIDLTVLLRALGNYGENNVNSSKTEYAVSVRGQKTPVNGIWYNSIEEISSWINGVTSNSGFNTNTTTDSSWGWEGNNSTTNTINDWGTNIGDSTDWNGSIGFLKIISPVKASAQEIDNPTKIDNSIDFENGLIQSGDGGSYVSSSELIEVLGSLESITGLSLDQPSNTTDDWGSADSWDTATNWDDTTGWDSASNWGDTSGWEDSSNWTASNDSGYISDWGTADTWSTATDWGNSTSWDTATGFQDTTGWDSASNWGDTSDTSGWGSSTDYIAPTDQSWDIG